MRIIEAAPLRRWPPSICSMTVPLRKAPGQRRLAAAMAAPATVWPRRRFTRGSARRPGKPWRGPALRDGLGTGWTDWRRSWPTSGGRACSGEKPRAACDKSDAVSLRSGGRVWQERREKRCGTSGERLDEPDARPNATRMGRALFRRRDVEGLDRSPDTLCALLLPATKNRSGESDQIYRKPL
jgi:hypothetical protein